MFKFNAAPARRKIALFVCALVFIVSGTALAMPAPHHDACPPPSPSSVPADVTQPGVQRPHNKCETLLADLSRFSQS